MPSYTQIERCIIILGRLACWKQVTIADLHQYFEGKVNVRTLQRDMLSLSRANIPLISEKGANNTLVWRLEPNYLKFIPLHLGLDEYFTVELMKNSAALFAGTPIAEVLQTALEKIRQLVPPEVIASTESRGDSSQYFGIHRYGYVDYSQYGEQLRTFLWSAANRKVCYVTYKRAGADKSAVFAIHPYTLLHHKGAFYGISYQPHHKDYIYLAIHRIENIDNADKEFVRDANFNLEEFLKDAFGIWKDQPEKVELKFSPDIASSIRERIWHPSQKFSDCDDGGVILTLEVPVNEELIGWVQYWGEFVEVLSPESLKERIKTTLKKILQKYE